jgi:FkbM family methyltransferase
MPNIADARRTYNATLGFVATRDELPVVLNERGLLGCGVEVGVKEGEFSRHLLGAWQGCHLISIDPWREDEADAYTDIANVPQQVQESFYQATVRRLSPFGGRSTIWRATSLEAARLVPHHSLDFAYLDARHDYDSVLEDLTAWFDRVRPGGILAGHDYLDGDFPAGRFGVRSAVDAFFAERGITVYATMLDEPCISWMVEIPRPDSRPALVLSQPEEHAPVAPAPTPAGGDGHEIRSATLRFPGPAGSQDIVLQLDPRHYSQRGMLEQFDHHQMYEPETSELLATVLRPGDIFIDVGAHVGYFSMLAGGLVGPQGRVVSFEPEERNYGQLLGHIQSNGLSQVTAINAAVGERVGSAEFHFNSDNDGGHALWDVGMHALNPLSRGTPVIRRVDIVSLDSIFGDEEIAPARVIKIDAEGSEHAVLLGARETLTRHPAAFVIVEINRFGLERMGTSEHALRATMMELGYETYAFDAPNRQIVRLGDDQYLESNYVFNLVFCHPEAAAA